MIEEDGANKKQQHKEGERAKEKEREKEVGGGGVPESKSEKVEKIKQKKE